MSSSGAAFDRFKQLLAAPCDYVARSLFRKILLLFFLTIAIVVSALGSLYYHQTSADIKARAIGNMRSLGEQSASKLETQLATIKNSAWDLFSDPEFRRFVERMDADPDAYSQYAWKFSKFMSNNPIAEFIIVSQMNGIHLVKGNIDNMERIDLKKMKAISIDTGGKGVWVETRTLNSSTGQMADTLTFVQAIRKIELYSDSKIIGFLVIQLSPRYLSEWLGGLGGGGQGTYALVDRKGGVTRVAANDDFPPDLNGMPKLLDVNSSQRVREKVGTSGDMPTLFVAHGISNSPWILVGEVSLKTLLRPVNELARQTMLITLLCFIGAMVLAGVLSSTITIPLKQLRKGMRAIERGDYLFTVPVRSRDEIGYIVQRFNQMAGEINTLVVKVYETDLVKKDAEIKSLHSQINPHFLYNTLGMIDGLAEMYDAPKISKISGSLARIFRYSISPGHLFPLKAEIRQLELYLYIQQNRFSERLSYAIEVEQGLDGVLIPKLLVQPLVENSFKHGIDYMKSGGQVRVKVWSDGEEEVYISVWNNGPAITADKLEEIRGMLERIELSAYGSNSASIGLANVVQRIKLVYGTAYGLSFVSSEEEGTTFCMHIRRLREEERPA
ncbi:two-component system sensor histidine kinase YesM [Paenibacillus taihuensis]|uniref:Two-component system sensor histidine kinase YesM n=1 Tax=Paenibacillus taihuensis TaxID=1156355 RepID=A0A3D9SCG8_9BACL|nr:sensor histidine kinase [Paenibacillus taihuensis]REE91581.1 two-component system sensor histidine kinase YesM [Paenibacillus taihuensis]